MKEKGEWHNNIIIRSESQNTKQRGDMAKLVDATDLIGLSLGMETY